MSRKYFSDQELLVALEKRDEAALGYLYYTYWPMILQMVKLNSGNQAEAEDLYQESILDFLEKVWSENFVLTCKLKSYIYSICRNKWLYHLRGRPKFIDIEEYVEIENESEDTMEEELALPDDDQITNAIKSLGEPCKTLLIGFYFERLTMEQLAVKLSYKSENVAKQQKFRCKDRLEAALMKTI